MIQSIQIYCLQLTNSNGQGRLDTGGRSMKIVGCIAEFNPFHHGHELYLKKAKEISKADAVVVVMSGDFVQRGEPAIINAERRTQVALSYGADLVLELHPAYVLASAEYFALGAIWSLEATGLITDLIFGSESGNIDDFYRVQDYLRNHGERFSTQIPLAMQGGLSYSSAIAKVLEQEISISGKGFFSKPNNILGIEYVKAMLNRNQNFQIHTYQRQGANYHDQTIQGVMESASAIRRHLHAGGQPGVLVPEKSLHSLSHFYKENRMYQDLEAYFPFLQYRICLLSPSALAQYAGCDEGMENLLWKKIHRVATYSELVQSMTSKRYPASRIKRFLLSILLGYTNTLASSFKTEGPSYLKPLGFTDTGQSLMKKIKLKGKVPLLSNVAESWNSDTPPRGLGLDLAAKDIYHLGAKTSFSLGTGLRTAPKKG